MKVINLLILMMILVSSLSVAQTNVFLLDTNVTYRSARFGQSYPVIAFGGSSYFTYWYDWRNKTVYHDDDWLYLNLYGCRVSPDGVLMDSAGILVSYHVWRGGYVPCAPAITYGAGNYFCAWSDFRSPYMLYGARIDTSGTVLDPDGFVISAIDSWKDPPAVTFDGVNYFVVWYDFRSTGGIYGCRISPDGAIIDPQGILLCSSGGGYVSVAYDGTSYFVVYSNGDLYGLRVDTAGIVLDTIPILICNAFGQERHPDVIFGEADYFVAWQDERFSSIDPDIYGARIAPAGVVLDSNGFVISILSVYDSRPAVAFDGTNYLVSWSGDYETTYCARVNTGGVLLDSVPIVVAVDTIYDSSRPSVAFGSTDYYIVRNTGWSEGDIYGVRVDTSGEVIDTTAILLSRSAYPGRASAAACDGTNYFAVWTDYRDSADSYIYGTRIDKTGLTLDPAGISIINGQSPAVAFDGNNYLMVCSGLQGVQIDISGTILDTLALSLIGNYPSIIFDAMNYFIVFEYGYDIYGIRVDTAGVVLDTNGILISNQEYYESYPAVAFDGTNYFVVWQYGTPLDPYNIYGAKIDTAGVLLDTNAVSIATAQCNQQVPSVAFDGTNYFVVWQDNRSGVYGDIYGTRVTPSGVVLDPGGIPICTAPSGQYQPQISFDGQNYCVVWEDWRNGNYTDIYGCYLTPSGQVIEEFVVSDQPNLQLEPNLTRGLDKYLITYSGFVDSINGRPANTMRIWGAFRDFTGIAEHSREGIDSEELTLQVSSNPMRRKLEMSYRLNEKCKVALQLFDVLGRRVSTLVDEEQESGTHIVNCDTGELVQGVYFVRLAASPVGETQGYQIARKVILLR